MKLAVTDITAARTRGLRTLAITTLPLTLMACMEKPVGIPPDSFMRIAEDGQPYLGSGDYAREPWPCVRDKRTGLIWEIQTDTPGLHYKDNTYSWYNPDEHENYGKPGKPDAGKCTGSACDTLALVAAVNELGWCGYKDWRVPTTDELATLADLTERDTPPTINKDFFPNTALDQYWTASAYNFQNTGAWAWAFDQGYDRVDWKEAAKRVRLVRGEFVVQTEQK